MDTPEKVEDVVQRFRIILDTMRDNLIHHWSGYFGPEGQVPDENMTRFLGEFREFSQAYFDGVVNNMPVDVTQNVSRVRRDLRRVIENLESNWGEILAVCNQRENPYLSARLQEVNGKVNGYYDRYLGYRPSLDGVSVVPLTYFGHRYEITRYPYTAFPLLSFRFEALGDEELMQGGLAHELGHFIYWNAAPVEASDALRRAHNEMDDRIVKQVKSLLSKQAKGSPAPAEKDIRRLPFNWRNWKEEVFGDVVGTLLVGPQYIKTSMRLYIDELRSSFHALEVDDETHPLPFLRPLIGLTVLEWLARERPTIAPAGWPAAWADEVKALRKGWDARFQEATKIPKATLSPTSNGLKRIAQETKALDKTVQKAIAAEPLAKAVVELLLTEKIWLDAHQQRSSLVDLFDLNDQRGVKTVEDVSQSSLAGSPDASMDPRLGVAPLRATRKHSAFEKLSEYVSAQIERELGPEASEIDRKQAQYRILVELSIAERRGNTFCRAVERTNPGAGTYILAGGSCGFGLSIVEKSTHGNYKLKD